MDKILIDVSAFTPKDELYTSYADYCRTKGYPIEASNTFHRELQKKIRIEDYKPSIIRDGKSQRVACWKGIKIEKNLHQMEYLKIV